MLFLHFWNWREIISNRIILEHTAVVNNTKKNTIKYCTLLKLKLKGKSVCCILNYKLKKKDMALSSVV